ncbi:MAG: hypothetical protein ACKPKO_35050, partial [Candidatus Fonsibacter sp.]
VDDAIDVLTCVRSLLLVSEPLRPLFALGDHAHGGWNLLQFRALLRNNRSRKVPISLVHISHPLPWACAALGRVVTDMSGRQWTKQRCVRQLTDEDKVATTRSGGAEEGPAKGGAFPLLPLKYDVKHVSNFQG